MAGQLFNVIGLRSHPNESGLFGVCPLIGHLMQGCQGQGNHVSEPSFDVRLYTHAIISLSGEQRRFVVLLH